MSGSKQKVYTSEFKESAVQMAIESKKPVAQTAKDLGIRRTTLYSWVDKYSKLKESGMGTDEHLYEENKRLKKELAIVREERDLLKKAAAYFAKESR